MPNRQLQVGEMIKRAISDILRDTLLDKILEGSFVIVSEVRMSADLKHATIYVLPITGSNISPNKLLHAFNLYSDRIKLLLCKRVSLRYAPKFTFKIDETFDKSAKITKLING